MMYSSGLKSDFDLGKDLYKASQIPMVMAQAYHDILGTEWKQSGYEADNSPHQSLSESSDTNTAVAGERIGGRVHKRAPFP